MEVFIKVITFPDKRRIESSGVGQLYINWSQVTIIEESKSGGSIVHFVGGHFVEIKKDAKSCSDYLHDWTKKK